MSEDKGLTVGGWLSKRTSCREALGFFLFLLGLLTLGVPWLGTSLLAVSLVLFISPLIKRFLLFARSKAKARPGFKKLITTAFIWSTLFSLVSSLAVDVGVFGLGWQGFETNSGVKWRKTNAECYPVLAENTSRGFPFVFYGFGHEDKSGSRSDCNTENGSMFFLPNLILDGFVWFGVSVLLLSAVSYSVKFMRRQ